MQIMVSKFALWQTQRGEDPDTTISKRQFSTAFPDGNVKPPCGESSNDDSSSTMANDALAYASCTECKTITLNYERSVEVEQRKACSDDMVRETVCRQNSLHISIA
jgi:hypothetical protein